MNIVYYIVGNLNKETSVAVTGGHGYTYDSTVSGKKNVVKNVPTVYGYFANSDYQSESVIVENFFNGLVVDKDSVANMFLKHIELILDYHKEHKCKKILLVTNMPKITNSFINNKKDNFDNDLFKRVFEKYSAVKDDVIFDFTLYPKGGIGPQQAHNQCRIGEMVYKVLSGGECRLDALTPKEFNSPDIEFNNLVTASRWYFNTGDATNFYELTKDGKRRYYFGKVDPDKNYYGKATPDVYYSVLYSKEPVPILDKLYKFCSRAKENKLNFLLAGNLNNIKSKEVARSINTIPGEFQGNQLISPMRIRVSDEPSLVDVIDPPGLSYRISDSLEHLDWIYDMFLQKENPPALCKLKFLDITDKIFTFSDKKVKINDEFVQNTLKIDVMIDSPYCVKPVKLGICPSYDLPDRNSFNSLIKSKITDIKVWLVLDFSNEAGVSYCTITETPDFSYIHSNSCSNLRVYNLRELGRAKE